MRKNFKNKFAAFMAFASLFGSKTSAMNSNKNQVKSLQTLGTVGGQLLLLKTKGSVKSKK